MRSITLITTGGTIEKTYDERSGTLANRHSVVHRMLRRLRLTDTTVSTVELMHKDSTELTDRDRARIADAVRALGAEGDEPTELDGVVILHGTDTLEQTGDLLHRELTELRVPVVLTGAMRPFEMIRSDAFQNLTEAVFAAGALPPGVYCVAHGRALRFPGVTKDRGEGTFIGGEAPR
ncbi:MAG: asparaginase [Planctomycetota bacterium]